MLPVAIYFSLVAGLAVTPGAGVERVSPSVLTVILDFKGPFSQASLKEMKRESSLVLQASGVRLDWRMLGEDPYASYRDLVVMTFRGACKYELAAPLSIEDALGPLAITHSVDGEIQPFGEVNCDRVVNSARNAMLGTEYARADLLIGRALGRVVTHELVHMITRSAEHGTEGVEKSSLSGRQLIAGELPLSAFDIDRLKQRLQYR
jgi:hypothetical protein